MQALLPVLLVVHIIACVALVVAVMLQRSEGGALGMGGGGTGGLISGRGVASVLVRTTMGLGALFFTTSVIMARLNTEAAKAPTAVERALKARTTDAFDPLKDPTAAPAPAATKPAGTATPAAPVLDPLAAPAPAAPAAATPATTPSPAAATAPADKPKPKAAEPVKPSTAPASPDTSPAKPGSTESGGNNGQ